MEYSFSIIVRQYASKLDVQVKGQILVKDYSKIPHKLFELDLDSKK